MKSMTVALALAFTSFNAWAGAPVGTVPEPGVLPLFAIGAVGGLALWMRSRNKK